MSQSRSSAGANNTPLVMGIHHCSLIVADTRHALDFYVNILCLEIENTRPDLGYPGVWLKVGGGQIHLLEVANPYSSSNRTEHGGRDYHVALQVSDIEEVIKRLETAGVAYSKSKSGRAALFCRDFDGNVIEVVEASG